MRKKQTKSTTEPDGGDTLVKGVILTVLAPFALYWAQWIFSDLGRAPVASYTMLFGLVFALGLWVGNTWLRR
jgi:hypothetical protein